MHPSLLLLPITNGPVTYGNDVHEFFMLDLAGHYWFNFSDLTPKGAVNQDVQYKYNGVLYNGTFHYAPFNHLPDPSGKTDRVSDSWACFNGSCHSLGNHEDNFTYLTDRVADYCRYFPPSYSIQAKEDADIRSLRVNLVCDSGESIFGSNIEIVNKVVIVTYSGPQGCSNPQRDPPISTSPSPSPVPPSVIPFDHLMHYEQNDKQYVSYNLSHFNDIVFRGSLTTKCSKEVVSIFISTSRVMSCPSGYNCTGAPQASAWKCWTKIRGGKECIAIADIRFGAILRASRAIMRGGYDGYSLELKLRCNVNESKTKLTIQQSGSESASHQLQLYASTSANCPVDIPPDMNVLVPSLGGYIVSIFWLFVTLVMGCTVVINYIRSKQLMSSFWVEFGRSVYNGWLYVSCGGVHIREQKNEVTYENL